MEKKYFDLTNPQKSIWYTEMFFDGSTVNNICVSGILNENVNIHLLKQAINILVQRNDSFRIKLNVKDTVPVQYFTDFVPFDIESIHINNKKEFCNIEKEFVNEKFSLLDSTLYKFKLCIFPDNSVGIILNIHHMIADSWSLGLTIKEIIKIYHSLINSEIYSEDTFSYKKYIESEIQYKNSISYQKDKEFWKEYLSNLPEIVTLPSKIKNPVRATSQAEECSYFIDADLMNRISILCRENKISVYIFFMSIFSIYFSNICNIDDLILGTPILNRSNFKDKKTTGMFVTTVPFRTKMSEESFLDFSIKNSINMFSIFRHQKCSYTDIIEDIRDTNEIQSLYNIAISYQITKATSKEIGNFETNWTFNNNCLNDINIHLYDINDTGNLKISYDFLTSRYSENEIEKHHNRILSIIDQVIQNPNINITDIEAITKQEKEEIFNNFNNRFLDCPLDSNIIKLFESQVEQNSDNEALIYKDIKLTYSQLNEKVNRFAKFLQTKGVKNNDIIGVYMNKTEWFIISILAIQKLGAAYLPMHPEYPEDRVKYILEDCKANVLITDNNTLGLDCQIINPQNISFNDFDGSNLDINIDCNSLCYVIYTSGSTGKPKGVPITHRNLINFVYNCNDSFNSRFTNKDNCLSVANISFDASVQEIFTPLCFGSTLVLYPENTLTDIPILCDILEENHITYTFLPPNILDDIFEFIYTNKKNFYINKLSVGVEPIKNSTLNNFYKLNENIEIINGYGPSEATICSTFYHYKYNENGSEIVPIGYPLKNNKIYILNKFNNLQPVDIPGELCISGENVSHGYLNNTEKTKKAFVKIDKYNNLLFYKTGDFVYWDKSGCISFIGRNDSQIKLRGHRVELSEINNNIKNIPEVINSVTLLKEINSIMCICSYVATKENYINEEYIKSILNDVLPYYMIPTHIICMENLPINKNGKIAKDELPEIKTQSTKMVLPKTSTEKLISEKICELLGLEKISIYDTFFSIGLDSLSAIRLSVEIFNITKINISIKDLFKYNSIKQLAEFIDNSYSLSNTVEIKKCEDKEYYELSSAQKRIYYAHKMIGENNIVYNVPGAIILDKILDKNKVENCFKKIIERQSSFRTSFVMVNGEVYQFINDTVDFSIKSYKDKSLNINNIINAFPKPFDLEEAPLLRVELCYLDNGKTLLLLDSHHIIMDGSSLKILIDDFCKLYNKEELSNLEIEYKDYSEWESNYIKSEKIQESEKYWLNKFQNSEIPSINLPYDYVNSSIRSYEGNTISRKMSKKLFNSCLKYAQKYEVSPYMFFVTAFFVLLYKYTGQNEIIIGTPTSGREHIELKNIIGMFVNNIVLDAKINSDHTFTDLLKNIKEEVINSLAHQEYPYDLLVKKLNLPNDATRNPLFDVMFTYQNTGENSLELDGKIAQFLTVKSNIAKFNLSLEIIPESTTVNIEYCNNLFKKDSIERLFDHYINTIKCILQNDDILIKDIIIISENEKNTILNKFNNTKLSYPQNKLLPELFEKIVKKYPNTIAVSHNNKNLTYKELNEKSNALAEKLIENGIQRGDTIGVCLNKSLELLISIFAILKVGAVYMPMYVDYPKDRLIYMLENSNAKLLITNNNVLEKFDYSLQKIIINSIEDIQNKEMFKAKYELSAEDIAYIIYTSGSTGKPKGVQITTKNLINFIYAFKEYYDNDITNKDIFLSSTNISFDVSIFEIFLPLLTGATLVLYTEEIITDILSYCDYIINNNITTLYIPPNILEEVYSILKDSTNLKINKLLVGVEPILKSTLNKYLKLNPDMKIINGYGPTETTICCTALRYELDESNNEIVSIGKPLYNDQIYILDKDKNIQPIGIIGDLYVTGDGVGIGYINNPSETNKNYLANIYNNKSEKMYKTGDLAKWNEDGTINFIGRNDSQVKISGHRIELKEINYIITQYPGVNKAISIIHKNGEHTYIVSYFIAENTIKIKDLLTFLKSKLANYMIPNFIMQLESFPLTVNGKIDKSKLPVMDLISNKQYVAPRNNLEKQIINIWKKLFLLDKIGINDNFFDLGGDSLTAIRFQIESVNLGLNISYSDIFSYPTPRELSEKCNTNLEQTLKLIENYDYKKLNKLVSNNTLNNIYKYNLEKKDMGNILLIGSTGFLGAHILDNFLSSQKGKAYCLIRKKSLLQPEERLRKTLNFYFNDKYNNEFGNRIIVINGDIIDSTFTLSEDDYQNLAKNVDTVINSAALVKHYGTFEQFNDTNVLGTKNIINFCKLFNKKLYHISTLSISGSDLTKIENTRTIFKESDFYIGQNLNNLYIYTKFEAEKLIYEEILNGLSACVFRIGNITNRFSDGKFQINTSENAFVNRIKSILKLGVIQDKFLDHTLEFTPVDFCADAIIRIINSNPQFTTFHLYNNNFIRFDTLLANLNSLDINLKPVSNDEFAKTVTKFLNSENLRNEISGIITDLDKNKLLNLINTILPNSDFTQAYLKLLNFEWPKIDIEYIKKYIKYFNTIKYIE